MHAVDQHDAQPMMIALEVTVLDLQSVCLLFERRSCGYSQLVAFSCKRRGFCPGCVARRAEAGPSAAARPDPRSSASTRPLTLDRAQQARVSPPAPDPRAMQTVAALALTPLHASGGTEPTSMRRGPSGLGGNVRLRATSSLPLSIFNLSPAKSHDSYCVVRSAERGILRRGYRPPAVRLFFRCVLCVQGPCLLILKGST